jgi:outer membrane protein assembly factor BamD
VTHNSSVGPQDFIVPKETAAAGVKDRARSLFGAGVENMRVACHTAARLQFQAILSTFPDSEYAARAKFAVAESYYREGTPEALASAGQVFAEFIRSFPTASQVPEARQRLSDIQEKVSPPE